MKGIGEEWITSFLWGGGDTESGLGNVIRSAHLRVGFAFDLRGGSEDGHYCEEHHRQKGRTGNRMKWVFHGVLAGWDPSGWTRHTMSILNASLSFSSGPDAAAGTNSRFKMREEGNWFSKSAINLPRSW